ncbi:MAG: hypothetical protein HYX40_05270 [Sphingobacteriales bacterium]|nr:hypothetical protein [Sphingobacteriales bacterium]
MPPKEYETILVIIVVTAVLVLAALFITILVVYMNNRKKKHLDEKQQMRNNFQQELLQSQLEIQEQTLSHLSQEIHDNVGQVLSLAKVQINIMNESEQMSRPMLDEVKDNISKALFDLRDIAKSLSSERIKAIDIAEAISQEATRINKAGIIQVTVSTSGQERKINNQKKLILFRIIQECLQNILKHADAALVKIEFCFAEQLTTTITDNGKGFDITKATDHHSGLGLTNIKTRAALAGGSSSIESKEGSGTTITINIPYE